jgi:hypothetical protein
LYILWCRIRPRAVASIGHRLSPSVALRRLPAISHCPRSRPTAAFPAELTTPQGLHSRTCSPTFPLARHHRRHDHDHRNDDHHPPKIDCPFLPPLPRAFLQSASSCDCMTCRSCDLAFLRLWYICVRLVGHFPVQCTFRTTKGKWRYSAVVSFATRAPLLTRRSQRCCMATRSPLATRGHAAKKNIHAS